MTEKQTTLLSEHIATAMEAKGLSIKDVAQQLGITYEHARRLSRGIAPPSRYVLKDMCALLELNFTEMQRLATADNIRRKYGTVPLELSGKDPTLEPVERAWKKLTIDQKEAVIATVQHYVSHNKTRIPGSTWIN